jgi:putative component of membrane protein insertase Oxa1/YidC/SpoIIIJ protein YidD
VTPVTESAAGDLAPRGLLLRALAWLILAYRRWLSGRGPLRGVRCSFGGGESCSAYGLRATAEASTARAALGRIVRRLRRCREACLLGDGETLSWAALHDRPVVRIVDEMRGDGERSPAIARMLGTRRVVALWRGERAVARQLAKIPPAAPLVCSHPATQARSRRRLAGFVLLAAVAAFAIDFRPWLGVPALLVAGVAAANAAHTSAERAVRFALHAALRRLGYGAGWRRGLGGAGAGAAGAGAGAAQVPASAA